MQVRLKRWANRHREVTEARENGDLHIAVEHLALEVLEKNTHERLAVLRGLITERTRNVTDDADGDFAQLRVLVRLESGV